MPPRCGSTAVRLPSLGLVADFSNRNRRLELLRNPPDCSRIGSWLLRQRLAAELAAFLVLEITLRCGQSAIWMSFPFLVSPSGSASSSSNADLLYAVFPTLSGIVEDLNVERISSIFGWVSALPGRP